MIPYGRQLISPQDIQAVVDVLNSDFLTQGPCVPEFEKSLTEYTGAKYALACNSATSALHLACLALELQHGDIVWTTPNTFVASANCALYCNASIDFVDIDPNTYNMSISCLEKKLVHAKAKKLLPKIIIPVHLCGQSCDMEKIYALSLEYGFKIIEDASHAIGGKYKNHSIGGCHFSDITIFSFHPVKIITSGEGGAALTNNADLGNKMNMMRTHGITNQPNLMSKMPEDEIWNYQQILLGFNYRMTDIQAALGNSQLSKIDDFIAGRQKLASNYSQQLDQEKFQLPFQHPDSFSSFHLYPILTMESSIQLSQKKIFQILRDAGIAANLHYIPVYRHPFYMNMGFSPGLCPAAEDYFRRAITIPLFPSLPENDQQFIIDTLNAI